jgi:cytosine/adenosine deaminase-related metal-dependent hydrolase
VRTANHGVIRYHARWVLPIARPPIAHATVAVDGSRIVYVGPRDGAPPGADSELGDAVLMPGLVNVHTHLELTTFRGFLERLPFRDWIVGVQRAKERVMSSASFLDAARLGLEEGLRAGITTYADTCDSGAALHAMRELYVRGIVYQEVFGPAPDACAASMAELAARLAALRAAASPLQRVGVSPHAPYTVSAPLFRAVASLAQRGALPVAVHVAESEAEREYVTHGRGPFADALRGRGIPVDARGMSSVQLLAECGVLETKPLLIHCVHVDARDVDAMARADCAVAHCPVSNAKLGHGVAPLGAMLDAGLRVGLGSDSVASNNRMDLLEEGRLAALLQRSAARDAALISSAQALELATVGGARALGLDAEIGTLEVGKAADLAAFPLEGERGVPVYAPEDALLHAVGARPARLVTVAGVERVRDGVVHGADPAVRDRVAAAARALARHAGSPLS